MFRREDIIDTLLELNLPMEEHWVLMDAALALHGVRFEVANIDIGCTEGRFQALIDNGAEVSQEYYDRPSITLSENVHVFKDWCPEQIDYIENIPVASLESVRKEKKKSKLKEDKQDIELIDKLLSILETI